MSNASIAFTADQRRCLMPFDQESTVQLAKRFNFADTLMQSTGDQILWCYRKGACRLSEARKVSVDAALGYELELNTTVEGPTGDAIDVLRELWSVLGELAKEEASELDESLGTFGYQTTAMVRLPKTYKELFPGLDLLARHTREGVGAPLVGAPGAEVFRVEARLSIAVGALQVERATFIEPRRTAKVDDRVFFTQSPLRSDQHLAMLEALCAMG